MHVLAGFRKSDALFAHYGGTGRLVHCLNRGSRKWIIDIITHVHRLGVNHVLPVKCHLTRSVYNSWAALKGVPLNDIYAAATWASSCTFARIYRVIVAAPLPVAAAVVAAPCFNRGLMSLHF